MSFGTFSSLSIHFVCIDSLTHIHPHHPSWAMSQMKIKNNLTEQNSYGLCKGLVMALRENTN